jgi:hypothetical protein
MSGVFDVLIELGQRGVGRSLRWSRRAHPAESAVASFLLGALIGGLVSVAWPIRLLSPGPVPGLSLMVTPVLNGLVMEWYGGWRERQGRERFFLATFWGGALFALGMAVVRYLIVGRT